MDQADADLYRSCEAGLIRFATMLVGPHDSADVVSTAVLACFVSPSWPGVAERRAYLYRAVANEARKVYRRRSLSRATERLGLQPSGGAPSPFDLVDALDVRTALARLSVRQRAVVYLTYWEDLTPVMCAERLGISEGAVRRYLRRARLQLSKALGDD